MYGPEFASFIVGVAGFTVLSPIIALALYGLIVAVEAVADFIADKVYDDASDNGA